MPIRTVFAETVTFAITAVIVHVRIYYLLVIHTGKDDDKIAGSLEPPGEHSQTHEQYLVN